MWYERIIFEFVYLQPLFEGGATPPPPTISTSTLDYPNNMYQSAFDSSESFKKVKWGRVVMNTEYTNSSNSSPSYNSIIKFLSSPVLIFSGLHLVKPHYVHLKRSNITKTVPIFRNNFDFNVLLFMGLDTIILP